MEIDHNFYMNLALNEAWKYQILTYPNPAVGALILDPHGKILSIEAHKKSGLAHAELNAVISALKDKKIDSFDNPMQKYDYIVKNYENHFKDHSIYTTLEPCNHYGKTPPCSLLIQKLGFSKVIIGSYDLSSEASGGINRLIDSGVEVIHGVLKEDTTKVIEPFLKYQSNKPFVFLKIATTLNGVYDGGLISSQDSLKLVHKIRDKIDLLVIGGETVRNDRPTLDARLVDGKAPDVLIYSKQKNFDLSIPLFNVKNRKVYIEDNFDRIFSYKLVMIEGGNSIAKSLKDIIDWYLIIRSSKSKSGKVFNLDTTLDRIYCKKNKFDTISWYKELKDENIIDN